MKEIPLTQGKVARVDDQDYPVVSQRTWCAHLIGGVWYARTSMRVPGRKYCAVFSMHRLIMRATKGELIDHADGDGLNNVRVNLRRCTRAENAVNSRKAANTSSRFKGVSWHRGVRRWRAHITIDYRTVHLGLFDSEEDAARAYNAAAMARFGNFARLNPVEPVVTREAAEGRCGKGIERK